MSEYTENGRKLGWGPGVVVLNPDKASFLKKYAKGKCLDIGCGSGIYSGYLSSLGHEVEGVDNEKEFVDEARRMYPQIKFHQADAAKLPLGNKQFDTVLLFDIIEHLDDNKVLKEAGRVGKRILISVPHSNQKLLTEYSLTHSHYLDKTHLRTYTPESLKKVIRKSKLKVIFCEPALPVSVSGLLIRLLSGENRYKKFILKTILKPFLPEPNIYSTVFAVAEKG